MCVAGCGTVTNRADKDVRVIADAESSRSAVSAARSQEQQRVTCASVRTSGPQGPMIGGNAGDGAGSEARLLSAGLSDMCAAYRDGQVDGAQYRAALEDYPALVVDLAGYRLVSRLTAEGCASARALEVGALIADNRALHALCRLPRFQIRLAVAGDAGGLAFARWCLGNAACVAHQSARPGTDVGAAVEDRGGASWLEARFADAVDSTRARSDR